MKYTTTVLLWLSLTFTAAASGQQPVANRLTSPHDAVNWASQHVQTLPGDQQPHVRYFWDHTGNPDYAQALSYALNASVSHASIVIQPRAVAGTRNQLWWIDLRWYYPDPEDYVRGHALFESLDVLEPYFHTIVVKKQVVSRKSRQILQENKTHVLVPVEPYTVRNDSGTLTTYRSKWVPKTEFETVDLVQTAELNPLVCDPLQQGTLLSLTAATRSNCPIMRLDWFVLKALTTIDEGYYYKFCFIEKSKVVETDGKKVRKTAQELFLANLGADEKVIANLGADNRTIIFRSGVAQRRPRMVEMYYGVNTRPISGVPLITMTHDTFYDDADPKRHPLRNLLSYYDVRTGQINDRGRECIGVKRNGFQIFALFDGEGELVDYVPQEIASDHTIPSPFSGLLQPGLSCIVCHGPSDGWIPMRNDLDWMLRQQQAQGYRLDIFDDLESPEDRGKTLERLAGQFKATDEQLDNAMRLARNGYADAVFRATKFSHLRIQGASVPKISRVIENIRTVYFYQAIDARIACYELGYEVDEKWAQPLFNQLLPPLPVNQFGFRPEDPIIAGIRSGTPDRTMGISRFEWEQVFQDAKVRELTQRAITARRTSE